MSKINGDKKEFVTVNNLKRFLQNADERFAPNKNMEGIKSDGSGGYIAGKSGLVPAPPKSSNGKFLRSDGTWGAPEVPTKVSELDNDRNFLTSSDLSAHTSNKNIHVTSTEKTTWNNKANKATTLSGYGITDAYTKTQVDKKVSDLVNSAPETLDTLNELASALGNDPNFATTVATQIGTKANANHNHDSVYVKLSGGTITNNINKVGISCNWKEGRTNAIVKTNATSSPSNNQYVPCISSKSYQGSWELGTYTNNDYYLTYITDADFDAGTNKATTQYKFCSNGTLIATKFQGNLVGNSNTATQFSSNAAVTLTGDVTGTASSKKGWSVAATVKNIPKAATFDITAEEIAAIIV